MTTSIKTRKRIEVKGIVQGVGFRPFIYKLAHQFELTGFVSNNNSGVEIEVEGDPGSIEKFTNTIAHQAPPLSQVSSIIHAEISPLNSSQFLIMKSSATLGNSTFISPDVSICDDCLIELLDKDDRRYLYPFTNCTNCGPRFTIIENIPYDRQFTTMKAFEMCDECRTEYGDPLNRRFHAQPNACPKCGPQIWLESNENEIEKDNVIENTVKQLLNGSIAAIKGLGGFHLAADANNAIAVDLLRERKNREAKPLAVMLPDIDTVRSVAECDKEEQQLLRGIERPIVLLKKKSGNSLAENIAPGNSRFGIMLPYTPLHYILFEELKKQIGESSIPALVMTSANLSEEPIAISNEDARKRLENIADVYLLHNRDILIRADDSVAIKINEKPRLIRRSRGYVPKAVPLLGNSKSILGLGAELKNTICLSKEDNAFISQHIGDLTNLKAYNFFIETIEHLQKIMDVNAEYFVFDFHPDYLSTKWAFENNGHQSFAIQHHHAHMASCMIENNINENVIGIILDGTGLGYDKTIWGGEILIGGYTEFERFAHLEQFPLPGGDAAAKEPWRIALSYLYNSFETNLPESDLFENYNSDAVIQLIEKKSNSPLTSSTGRLFDAVSFIAGGTDKIRYEAEAAIQLTQLVNNPNAEYFQYDEIQSDNKIIPLKKLIRNIFEAANAGMSQTEIANRFHSTFSKILIEAAVAARDEKGIKKVVLSGGVFQNEILLTQLEKGLTQKGFEVFSHANVPTNDGGISLGQVAVAAKLLENKMDLPNFIN